MEFFKLKFALFIETKNSDLRGVVFEKSKIWVNYSPKGFLKAVNRGVKQKETLVEYAGTQWSRRI